MFNYGKKNNAMLVGLLIVLIVATVFLVRSQNSRSKDLELVSRAQVLATGLELYFDDFNVYPKAEKKTSANGITQLTENGVNQKGKKIYYQSSNSWPTAASYQSNGTQYSITFELQNKWSSLGLTENHRSSCFVKNNLVLGCL